MRGELMNLILAKYKFELIILSNIYVFIFFGNYPQDNVINDFVRLVITKDQLL